jgi:hypothetical protein
MVSSTSASSCRRLSSSAAAGVGDEVFGPTPFGFRGDEAFLLQLAQSRVDCAGAGGVGAAEAIAQRLDQLVAVLRTCLKQRKQVEAQALRARTPEASEARFPGDGMIVFRGGRRSVHDVGLAGDGVGAHQHQPFVRAHNSVHVAAGLGVHLVVDDDGSAGRLRHDVQADVVRKPNCQVSGDGVGPEVVGVVLQIETEVAAYSASADVL